MNKLVCVVDDQLSLRQMLRFALNINGLSVVEAEHGLDAFDKLACHEIDMMIVDWQMPHMDGLELVRQLRKIEKYAELPIVIVSCRDDLEARREARALGVLSWLKKPFRISEVQLIVESVLGIHSQAGNRNTEQLTSGSI